MFFCLVHVLKKTKATEKRRPHRALCQRLASWVELDNSGRSEDAPGDPIIHRSGSANDGSNEYAANVSSIPSLHLGEYLVHILKCAASSFAIIYIQTARTTHTERGHAKRKERTHFVDFRVLLSFVGDFCVHSCFQRFKANVLATRLSFSLTKLQWFTGNSRARCSIQ